MTYNTTGTCQPFNIVQCMIKDNVVWLTCGDWYLLCMLYHSPVLFRAMLFDMDLLSLHYYLVFEHFYKWSRNIFDFPVNYSSLCVNFIFTAAVTRLVWVVFVSHIWWHYYLQWFCFLSCFAGALLGPIKNCFGCWYHGTLWKDPHRLFSCWNSRTDSFFLTLTSRRVNFIEADPFTPTAFLFSAKSALQIVASRHYIWHI